MPQHTLAVADAIWHRQDLASALSQAPLVKALTDVAARQFILAAADAALTTELSRRELQY